MESKLLKLMPDNYRNDLKLAIQILKTQGCHKIFLFGSLVHNDFTQDSDIDIAVDGLPKGSYFSILGKLIMNLEHPVDLIDLSHQNRFVELIKNGELIRVA